MQISSFLHLIFLTLFFSGVICFYLLLLLLKEKMTSTPKKSAFDVLMNKTNKIKELNEKKSNIKIESRIDNDIIIIKDEEQFQPKTVVCQTEPEPTIQEYFDENFFQHTHQYLGLFEWIYILKLSLNYIIGGFLFFLR